MASVKFQNVAPQSELHKPTRYRPELNGFDDTAAPVWQMVPVKGTRFVQISVLGAKTWTVEGSPTMAVDVTQESGAGARKDVYQIDGKQEGKAFVIVRGPKREELGRLEVWVMRQRTMAVQFFLVADTAKHMTRTKEDDVRAWVDDANSKVFERQLNLRFNIAAVKPVTITQDLGNPIDLGFDSGLPYVPHDSPGAQRWHAITDKGDPKKEVFNFFCVWDFKHQGAEVQDQAFVQSKQRISASDMEKNGANYNMCLMKDIPLDDIGTIPHLVFAHEAGHYLEGMPFHYEDDADSLLLMRGDGMIGPRLMKRDAEKMTRRW